jgi:hypothetical protein
MLVGTKNYLGTCTRYENSQCISKELFVRSRKTVNIGNVNSRSTGTHFFFHENDIYMMQESILIRKTKTWKISCVQNDCKWLILYPKNNKCKLFLRIMLRKVRSIRFCYKHICIRLVYVNVMLNFLQYKTLQMWEGNVRVKKKIQK